MDGFQDDYLPGIKTVIEDSIAALDLLNKNKIQAFEAMDSKQAGLAQKLLDKYVDIRAQQNQDDAYDLAGMAAGDFLDGLIGGAVDMVKGFGELGYTTGGIIATGVPSLLGYDPPVWAQMVTNNLTLAFSDVQGPLDFFKKIGEGIKQDYVGKYNSEGLAYVIGCGTFDIMTIFLGFTKLGKLGKLGEFAEETTKGAKVTEGVEGAVDVAKINRLLEVDKFLDEYVPKQYQNQIKSAFEDDIKVTTLDEDKVVYRYYGGKAGASSYWVSPTKVKDPIADLALPPGNTAENMDQVILPKGTKVLEGTVAPNFGQPGGGYQYYVPDIKTIGG